MSSHIIVVLNCVVFCLFVCLFVCFQYADNVENHEIEMQPNKAYETVTRPCSSRPAISKPDYEALDHLA